MAATDTADRIVGFIESLLPSTDPRPHSHRIGPAGTGSGFYLTGATDAQAQAECDRLNATRPAACAAARPFTVWPL